MKKIFFTLALIATLVLPASSVAFAAEEELPDLPAVNYSNTFMYEYGYKSYRVMSSAEPSKYVDYGYVQVPYSTGAELWEYDNSTGDGEWVLLYEELPASEATMSPGASTIVWSNFDICYSNSDEIFFQAPQLILGVPKQKFLTALTEVGLLQEIVSLLPTVIPCWIGYLALRKGLSFLMGTLRKA